jgi:hypothetical protein
VFLAPFWYVNSESKVIKPTSLAMLKLMTKLQTPSTTHELIECLSKVLDGTPVACGSWISKRPNVVFRVSFNTIIMSLVLNFKSWKLNYNVLTSFCATSRIWNWHCIGWLVENCVFSWCTCTPGTREFDGLTTCGVVVSSPFTNKVRSSSVLKGRKDYGMTSQTLLALVIGLELDASPSI